MSHTDIVPQKNGGEQTMTVYAKSFELANGLCGFDDTPLLEPIIAYFTDDSLQWRHNDHDCISNHQLRGCLLNRLFRRRSKKTPKLRVNGLCVGNSPGPVNSPHKGPVTRKMFPFDDVIMLYATEPWCLGHDYSHKCTALRLWNNHLHESQLDAKGKGYTAMLLCSVHI